MESPQLLLSANELGVNSEFKEKKWKMEKF